VSGNFELHAVTGAFGFTGRYIAQRLINAGKRVRALIGRNRPNPFGDRIEVARLQFDDFQALVDSLKGVDVLYNTYWVRFNYGETTFERAVQNSQMLIRAAEEAGVRRLVHISITNPSEDSPLPYFRGKALVERAIRNSSLSYGIIRPTVLFGEGDILLNNIAYFLRRFPIFIVPGKGDYRLQPVYVDDVAALAVEAGERMDNFALDAVGPEVFTFAELVRLIRDAVGSKAKIVHAPPSLTMLCIGVLNYFVNDIVLTREELEGLMANLLVSDQPPTCPTRFSEWLRENAKQMGLHYASELKRHFLIISAVGCLLL
jgi:NADH dehydrogenase